MEDIRKAAELNLIEEKTIWRMMVELQRDLAQQVRDGDLTPEQANEWANHKADQWAQGLG